MNISPKHFLQGSSVAFLVYYLNPKMHYMKIIGIGLAAILVFYFLDRNNIIEKFSSADETREVRYGDTVTLYSHNGFYLSGPEDPVLSQEDAAMSEFNISDYEIGDIRVENHNLFTIEDASDETRRSGQRLNIRASSSADEYTGAALAHKIYLRAVSSNRYIKLSYNRFEGELGEKITGGTQVILTTNKSDATQFLIETIDPSSVGVLKYGDSITFKGTVQTSDGDKNLYLGTFKGSLPRRPAIGCIVSRPQKTFSGPYYSSMKICDENGMGNRIDWAKQSYITTGTSEGFEENNGPENLVDGSSTTFARTVNSNKGSIIVILPENVFITQIVIKSRKNADITSEQENNAQDQLGGFTCTIMDAKNGIIDSNTFQTPTSQGTAQARDEYNWNAVHRIGRKVEFKRISDNKIAATSINIYGSRVRHSILLENPVMADVFSGMVMDKDTGNMKYLSLPTVNETGHLFEKTIEHQQLPYSNSDVSYCFWMNASELNLNADNTKDEIPRVILNKGIGNPDSDATISSAMPGIFLRRNTSDLNSNSFKLQVLAAASDNTIEKKLIEEPIPVNKDTHVAVLITTGVLPQGGWVLGDFHRDGQYYAANSNEGALYNPPEYGNVNRYQGKWGNAATNNSARVDAPGLYIIHPKLKKFYSLISKYKPSKDAPEIEINIERDLLQKKDGNGNSFFDQTSSRLFTKSYKELGYTYLGPLLEEHVQPTMKIYFNGKLVNGDNYLLAGTPIFNDRVLEIGSRFKGEYFRGHLYDMKYCNYLLSENQIQTLSTIKSTDVVKTLYWGKDEDRSASLPASRTSKTKTNDLSAKTYSHAELPQYTDTYTICFWMKVVNSDSNKVYLFRKGINTNEPSIQIYGRKQTLRLLIDTTSSPNGYPFTFGNLLDKDEYPTGDNPYTPK